MTEDKEQEYASPQERLGHAFSKPIFGIHALFCPEKYGSSEEPADLAWVSNRCAFLFYMTGKSRSYKKSVGHNLVQMHRWLRHWRSGRRLRGVSNSVRFDFGFDDIDHVVGISIIGSQHIWCEYHDSEVAYSKNNKLAACATFTLPVIELFGEASFTPRDILRYVRELHIEGTPISEKEILETIDHHIGSTISGTLEQFKPHLVGISLSFDFLEYASRLFTMLKLNVAGSDQAAQILSDVRFAEICWIICAGFCMQAKIAKPGEAGNLAVMTKLENENYTFQIAVCSSMNVAREKVLPLIANITGISLIFTLDFGHDSPACAVIINPRAGPSLLEGEIVALRDATLTRLSQP